MLARAQQVKDAQRLEHSEWNSRYSLKSYPNNWLLVVFLYIRFSNAWGPSIYCLHKEGRGKFFFFLLFLGIVIYTLISV